LKNLAPSAKISATSEYNSSYQAKFVADGKIPGPGSGRDLERAWAANGLKHRNGAAITFEWPAEITVAEIVYYGRTAFESGENWKDYEVYLNSSTTPAVKGKLKSGHGPQRIKLARATKLKQIKIKFTSSYGGSNPGASEIQIYSISPPAKSLGKLTPFAAPRRGGRASFVHFIAGSGSRHATARLSHRWRTARNRWQTKAGDTSSSAAISICGHPSSFISTIR
jgi:hypothetical protein